MNYLSAFIDWNTITSEMLKNITETKNSKKLVFKSEKKFNKNKYNKNNYYHYLYEERNLKNNSLRKGINL